MEEPIVTLPLLLRKRAEEMGNSTFIESAHGGSWTYAETQYRTLQWADTFRAFGVKPGQTVATMGPTTFDSICAWLGLAWLRAIEVPIHTAFRGAMLSHVLNDCHAETILVSGSHLGVVAEVASELASVERVVLTDEATPPRGFPFDTVKADDLLETNKTQYHATPSSSISGPEPHDIAAIVYTSGTTGASKGVLVPWAQLHAKATGMFPRLSAETFYSPFGLFHVSGKTPIFLVALTGGKLVFRRSFESNKFWTDVAHHECTTTLLIGGTAASLMHREPSPDDADNPLRNVTMAPLIPDVAAFRERFGVRVCTLFDMTELSPPLHSGWDVADTRTCGQVRRGYEVRIVDEHDREVPVGTKGELIVRADQPWTLMAGYWGRPEATVEAWRNQWLHTGDAFIRDEAGDYYFVDRLKDTIRRRGENIASSELESEVNTHPDVQESAAVGVQSSDGEDDVKIVVVPLPGKWVSPGDLIAYLEKRVPKFMVPRYVEHAHDLPRTPTEKVRKTELRAAGVTESTWDRLYSHRST